MAYLTGLLSGFAGRKAEVEQENLRRAELAADREARVYEALLSSPDQEIQSLAATGLLESAQPKRRKGGLKGWIGEMEQSPTLERLQTLIRTPVTEERVTPGLPSRTLKQEVLASPVSAAPAAQPSMSPTEPGAPPPVTPTVAAPPPNLFEQRAGPAVGRTEQVTRPRQVFATPGDVAAQQAAGQYGGRARGLMQAYREAQTPEEQRLVLELSGFSSGAAPFQPVTGIMPDGTTRSATYDRSSGQFIDPATREPLIGFRQTSTATTTQFGGVVRGEQLPAGSVDSAGRPVVPNQYYRRQGNQLLPVAPPGDTPQVVVNPLTGETFVIDRRGVQATQPGQPVVEVPRPGTSAGATPETANVGGPPPAPAGPLMASAPEREAAELLSPAEASQLGLPYGTRRGQVPQGRIPLDTQTRQAVQEIEKAETLIPEIRRLVQQVYGGLMPTIARGVPFIGGAVERAAQEVSLTTAMNSPEFARLRGLINLAIPGVARLSGNRGNLTELEQQRAATLFPNLGEGLTNLPDTLAAALAKLEQIESSLGSQRMSFLGGAPTGVGSAPPAPGGSISGGARFYQDAQGNWVIRQP